MPGIRHHPGANICEETIKENSITCLEVPCIFSGLNDDPGPVNSSDLGLFVFQKGHPFHEVHIYRVDPAGCHPDFYLVWKQGQGGHFHHSFAQKKLQPVQHVTKGYS
jgi:hypothetical protein